MTNRKTKKTSTKADCCCGINQIEKKLELLESKYLKKTDEVNHWRLKYFKSEERASEAEAQLKVLENDVKNLEQELRSKKARIEKLRDMIFGERSERKQSSSESKSNSEDQKDCEKRGRGKPPGSGGYTRKPPPPDIDHDEQTHEITDELCCPSCKLPYKEVNGLDSTEFHFEMKVVYRTHWRKKAVRTCRCPEAKPFVIAKQPPRLIPKSKFSTEFLVHVLFEKYMLQRPLNRICLSLGFHGYAPLPGTLTRSFKRLYEEGVFDVIYQAIIDRSRANDMWHFDETGWKVWTDDKGVSPRWFMWVASTSDTCVFILDPKRSHNVVKRHLHGVTDGIIISDRAKAYIKIGNDNPSILIAFCWVHQRRDFIDLAKGFPELKPWTDEWVELFDLLMLQNKNRFRSINDPKEFKVQDDILRKMIQSIEKRFRKQLKDSSLKEEQLAVLRSLDEHWGGLTVFVNHPYVPMDNNEAERLLRNLVVGRNNYYGSRSEWAGHFTAQLATIFETLKKNDINPHQWLLDYCRAVAENDGQPPSDSRPFYPWIYKNKNSEPSPEIIELKTENTDELSPLTITLLRQPQKEEILASRSPP